jgi:hypothetical protein
MRDGLPVIATTLALSLGFAPPAHADSLCAALAYAFPQCHEKRATVSPGTLTAYRMNNSASQVNCALGARSAGSAPMKPRARSASARKADACNLKR